MLILDDRLATGFTAGPMYVTSIVPLSGGRERRNRTWTQPKRVYRFGYTWRDMKECQEVEDFFHDVSGRHVTFLMPDFTLSSDKVVLLGTGDGADTTFQARMGYGRATPVYVDVTNLKPNTLTVYVNGSPVTVTSEVNGLITLAAAPGNGLAVTAKFGFWLSVRFEQDSMEIEADGPNARYGRIQNLSAMEVR